MKIRGVMNNTGQAKQQGSQADRIKQALALPPKPKNLGARERERDAPITSVIFQHVGKVLSKSGRLFSHTKL